MTREAILKSLQRPIVKKEVRRNKNTKRNKEITGEN